MIIHRLDIIAGFIHCIMFSECLQLLRIDWCENLLTFTVQFKSCWPNWETKTRHLVLILKKIMFYELLLILQKLMKTNKTDDFFFFCPCFIESFLCTLETHYDLIANWILLGICKIILKVHAHIVGVGVMTILKIYKIS